MEANYELCEKCEANMEASGVFGYTTQQMYEQEAEFHFDLAFALLSEGHYVIRKSEADKDQPRVLCFVETKDSTEENPHYEIGIVDLVTDNILSYTTLANEDIFAGDWMIAKVKEAE